MPQIINPLMTQALDAYSTTQSDFAKRASAVSKNSKTAGNPSASPSDYVSILNKRFDLAMKTQAKTNATAALSYCKVTASGQQAIKDAFAEITTLALKNATDSTSSQERLINQQSLASKIDQITQVNKTVSLNSGQPTTSGAALVIPKPTAANGACYLANYNSRAFTNVGSIAPLSTVSTNAVYTIASVAQKDASNVTFSYYKDGGSLATANVNITGSAALGSEPVGFSSGLLSSGTSTSQTLNVANNFIKQKAMNSATADTEGDLVSMISVAQSYAPDSRIGATTVQSNKYTNMYAKVKSTVNTTSSPITIGNYVATIAGDLSFTGCTGTSSTITPSSGFTANTFFDTGGSGITTGGTAITPSQAFSVVINGLTFNFAATYSFTPGQTDNAYSTSVTTGVSCSDSNVTITAAQIKSTLATNLFFSGVQIAYTYKVTNFNMQVNSGQVNVKTGTSLPTAATDLASGTQNGNASFIQSVSGIQEKLIKYQYAGATSDITTTPPTFTTGDLTLLPTVTGATAVSLKKTGTVTSFAGTDITSVADKLAGNSIKFEVDTGRERLSSTVATNTTQQTLVLQNATGTNSDVTIDLSSIQNPTVAISDTFIQFGGAALKAQFQDSDNPTSSTEIDLTAMTPRALGLDAISILTKEDSVAAMTTLKDIQTDILKIMATTQLGVAKLELARDQLDINIVATEEVIDATDGINPLEEAQFMASLDQQMQSNVIIISKTISQGRTAQQAFSDLLR